METLSLCGEPKTRNYMGKHTLFGGSLPVTINPACLLPKIFEIFFSAL
jgi:hypothetical protein